MRIFGLALLLPLGLVACSSVHYEGQVVDDDGVARQGLPLTLSAISIAERRYVDRDVVGRAEPFETTETDARGAYAIDHATHGGSGCGGLDEQLAVVVAPEGADGPVAVALTVGEPVVVHLPGALSADADADGVYVAVPAGRSERAFARVDGQLWRLEPDGVLPATALLPCSTGSDVCEHPITLEWHDASVHARGAQAQLRAPHRKPAKTVAASARGEIFATLGAPLAVEELVVDGLFDAGAAIDASTVVEPVSVVVTEPSKPQPHALADCAVRGTGLRCATRGLVIDSLRLPAPTGAQLRLFTK